MIKIYGESETLLYSKTILFFNPVSHFPYCCIVSTTSELPFVEAGAPDYIFWEPNEKLVIIITWMSSAPQGIDLEGFSLCLQGLMVWELLLE